MAPAERVDFVFDFSAHAGEKILLRSDAFDIMEFRVAAKPAPDASYSSAAAAVSCHDSRKPRREDAPSHAR